MANIDNQDKENNNTVGEKIGHSVQKKVENMQETAKHAAELASDAINHPVETATEFSKQAAKDVTSVKWWARLLQVIFWLGLSLLIAILVIINLDVTKQWAAKQALQVLNQDFKAEMTTQSVNVDYFGDVTVKGLKIKDYKGLEFIKAREFRANSDWFALAKNAISPQKNNALSFRALSLVDADIKVITYEGDSISNFIRYTKNFDTGKKRDPNKPPFQLNSRVDIINSKVSIINRNSPGEKGKWLYSNNLNLHAPSVKINGPDVFAQINNMTFTTERWGKKHFVDTFSTDLALTGEFLSLNDLTLNTDHTLLQGDLKFVLNKKTGWADFVDKVRWELELKQGSQVSGYDISYFVTQWDNYKPFNISGKMSGPLNRFYLEDFLIRNPQVNIRTNTLSAKNLLKGNFQIETNYISTDFTYRDLKAMLPTFIAKKLKNIADDFGKLKYNGAVRVTPQQVFVPNGNLITGIGQAKINNFYLEDFSTPNPKYRGFFDVKNINAAAFTKSKQVGLITGKFNLQGESFDINKMRIRTKSNIASIEILGKEIHNLYLNGFLDRRTYKGIINVNDEQAKADLDGFIDFRTKKIGADILANIKYLNLNYFTGKAGQQIVSGQIDGDMSMTNINDLMLDANFKNINFAIGNQRFLVPNADLKTYFENGNRVIDINAPGAVRGSITGKYNLGDLSGMIQNGFSKILVGPPPRRLYRGQHFSMSFDVEQVLVSYFEQNLKIPQGAKISGSYEGNSNNLVLNVDAASLSYLLTKQNEISDADRALAAANPAYQAQPRTTQENATVDMLIIRINTANLAEQIFAKVDRAEYGKNVFRDLTLTGRNEDNRLLHLSVNFRHGTPEQEIEGTMKNYAININQSTNKAGDYVLRFEPTEVKFNNVVWNIDTSAELNHSITYRKKTSDFLIENLRLYSDESEILMNRAIFKSAKEFDADAVVKNLQIAKLLEMQPGGNNSNIKGIANGTMKIRMNANSLEPIIDLKVDGITMNDKAMGDLVINAKNSGAKNIFQIDTQVISAAMLGNNNLHLTGTVNNNTASPTLDLKADLKDFDIAFAQEFVKGVFSNLRGKANGLLSISGTLKDINYNGDIALSGFGLKLNFTGVDYSFEDTVVPLSRGLAILNNVDVKDGRSNSSGAISGTIQFETLSSMGLNLIMRADNLLLLNTQQKDNNLFWGRVYGQGDLFVSGPVTGLDISSPNMRALQNSSFTFNSNSTSNVDEFKMLRFLKEDNSGMIVTEDKRRSGANINVDFTLDVDKGTLVNVLVGDDVGDITVRGEAKKLRFRMFRNGNLSMNGDYFVDSGTFVSRAILERTFQIAKGSSIKWDGDILAPQLDISAGYLRTVTNAGQYLGIGSLQPINVLLSVKITETLANPKVVLDVTAPDISSQLKETLAAKLNSQDEKVLQFGSILVLNSFNVANSGGLDLNVGNTLESSGYNILFKQLGSVLNTISNEVQVDMNFLKGDQASNTGDRANASLTFAISPRVKVKTGLGVPLSKTDNTGNDYLSGEGIIEYDWSKNNDGTKLLRAYSKPANIGLVAGTTGNPNANQTYGVGVVYSRSFNTIFKRKKKKTDIATKSIIKDSIKTDSIQREK